ncbi:hypothetical protein GCM10025794_15730 [Massilia kyonggiensis]
MLVAAPILAWPRFSIASGTIPGDILNTLTAHFSAHLLAVTESFSQRLQEKTDLAALRQQSIADGMKPLRIAGAYKVIEGVTTVEEVLKSTVAH